MKAIVLMIVICALTTIGMLLFEMHQLKQREELKPFLGQKVIFTTPDSSSITIQ